MKKLNQKIAKTKKHKSLKTHQKNLKRRNKVYIEDLRVLKLGGGKKVIIIKAPPHFDIYDIHKKFSPTLDFLSSLKKQSNDPNISKIILNFGQTINVKAAAMVLLFATIEAILQTTKIQIAVEFITRNDNSLEIKRLIQESGVLTLCNTAEPENCFNRPYMPIISSQGGKYREEIVDFIMNKIYDNKMTPLLENAYASAVQEAINNVSAHAYDKEKETKKWWLKCSYIKSEQQLYLVIYDNGVGIPNTFLQDKNIYTNLEDEDFNEHDLQEFLEHLHNDEVHPDIMSQIPKTIDELKDSLKTANIAPFPDHLNIFAAMIGDLTGRTDELEIQKHGQGSKSIRGLVKNNGDGVLWIYSNNGLVKYYGDNDKTAELDRKKPDMFKLDSPIKGTLIQWNIKVEL